MEFTAELQIKLEALAHQAHTEGSAMLNLTEAREIAYAMNNVTGEDCRTTLSYEARTIHTYQVAHEDGWTLRMTVDPKGGFAYATVSGNPTLTSNADDVDHVRAMERYNDLLGAAGADDATKTKCNQAVCTRYETNTLDEVTAEELNTFCDSLEKAHPATRIHYIDKLIHEYVTEWKIQVTSVEAGDVIAASGRIPVTDPENDDQEWVNPEEVGRVSHVLDAGDYLEEHQGLVLIQVDLIDGALKGSTKMWLFDPNTFIKLAI